MDIVYFVKNTSKNPELICSVRSVCENFPYHKIWFLGGCPEGIVPDNHISIQPISKIKTKVTANLFKEACTNPLITDDFILFNDDFFILEKITTLPPRYYSTLEETADRIKHMYSQPTKYTALLEEASRKLKEAGCTTYNFDMHVPMIINKEKMLEVMEKFPGIGCKRSLYGNYYELWRGGVEKRDVKIHGMGPYILNGQFCSTDDETFLKGETGRTLKRKFPEACRYEPKMPYYYFK